MDRGDPLSSLGLVVAMLGDQRCRNDILTEAAGFTAGSWYTSPSGHVGHELIAAGMLILAGGGHGVPPKYTELERWTRRLGTQMLDEVRRRVQQDTLGWRGHKDDPLYKIRGLLRHGVEHLTDKQQAKIGHCLDAGDPHDEVNVTWQCYQQLRSIYHAALAKGRQIAAKVLDSFHTCPIPEVARLGVRCAPGGPRCWPTSTPQGSPIAALRPST